MAHIPPPPPLDPDLPTASDPSTEITNTLALLLPHSSLFHPPVLSLLREHYASFGPLAHWAPVRAFGRVILVYEENEDAADAKREGDRLRIELEKGDGYFANKPIILRLHPLPPTPLLVDPSTTHLRVPESERNFLISPPGSPPEGWEPIVEDGPNTDTLAEDLRRALEALQLAGGGRGRGRRGTIGPEVILEEGGVRVEVEDTSVMVDDQEGGETGGEGGAQMEWGEERLQNAGSEIWRPPSQDGEGRRASLAQAMLEGAQSPMGRVRIMPTAMPPLPGQH